MLRPLAWLGLGGLVIAAAVAIVFVLMVAVSAPAAALFGSLDDGVSLRTAAIAGVAASVALLIVLAVAAGDGLVGEFQYMLAGFFLFFVFFTLFVAWVF
jgi:hypothetical protein